MSLGLWLSQGRIEIFFPVSVFVIHSPRAKEDEGEASSFFFLVQGEASSWLTLLDLLVRVGLHLLPK